MRPTVIEKSFESNGHTCLVTFSEVTWCRCGYVLVENSSILFGRRYDEVRGVTPHGGLTFSDYIDFGGSRKWALGFDCAHYGDEPDVESGELLLDDAPPEVWAAFPKMTFWGDSAHVWTLDDVVSELEEMSAQMARIEGATCKG